MQISDRRLIFIVKLSRHYHSSGGFGGGVEKGHGGVVSSKQSTYAWHKQNYDYFYRKSLSLNRE